MINWERRDIWEQQDVEMIAWSYEIVDELLCHWIFNCTIEWRAI